jgi:hypothetical protein
VVAVVVVALPGRADCVRSSYCVLFCSLLFSSVLFCSLLFSSVLPVRVCPPDASCFRCLLFRRYGLNRFVDLGFIVDMVVNFFMAYLNTRIGVWEFRGHLIVAKYVLSV